MKKRTTRTYTIDDEIYKDFEKIIKEKSLNRSRLIESLIIKFIKENEVK
jgi:metal-responsive CopG/Arc/MetJ family transcriptional regulator